MSAPANAPDHGLPAGFRLRDYRIETVLGEDAGGITYRALDGDSGERVAIREFLPRAFAVHGNGAVVSMRQEASYAAFRTGLERFIAGGRGLAALEHPGLARVRAVFEANGSAYLVTAWEPGTGLDELAAGGRADGDEALRAVAMPLLDALEYIHAAGYIHGNVNPASVTVRDDGSPVLLDPDAASVEPGTDAGTVAGEAGSSYAAIEQCIPGAGDPGPWTDIYALGATLYACMNRGRGPADAAAREQAGAQGLPDPMEPVGVIAAGRYSSSTVGAVEAALAVHATRRPRTVGEWRVLFAGEVLRTVQPRGGESGAQRPVLRPLPVRAGAVRDRRVWAAGLAAVVLAAGGGFVLLRPPPPPEAAPPPRSAAAPVAAGGDWKSDPGQFAEKLRREEQAARDAAARLAAAATSGAAPGQADTSPAAAALRLPDPWPTSDSPATAAPVAPVRTGSARPGSQAEPAVQPADARPEQAGTPQPQPAGSPETQPARIAGLLDAARSDLVALRLTSPKGRNAAEKFQEVLRLDPGNAGAEDGLEQVVARYVELVDRVLVKGDVDKAQRFLDRAASLRPESPLLAGAQARITAASEGGDRAAGVR